MRTDLFVFDNTRDIFSPTKLRKGMTWGGIVLILLGVAALVVPTVSSLVVGVIVGWLLAASGAVTMLGAFSLRRTGLFLWEMVPGVLIFAAGLMLILYPQQGLIALTLLIALAFLLSGTAQISFSLWLRPAPGWGWGILSAVVSLAFAGFILFALPEASAVLIGVLVGFDMLSTGLALVMIARSGPLVPLG